ncbi:hypothetical protein DH2020_000794 [Rehmannia glutinosa]|uniref:Myb-like domain-containing protein n=1 Tax=Rehmannia glutinosa TaxID=99300 RepID=A0ABR0XXH6_REHGL
MAASANPSGVHSNGNNNNGNSNSGVQENGNGGSLSATENSLAGPTQTALRHNPGLSLDWTPEEQSTLEDLLTKYASEANIVRYAKIAQSLKDKTVRDVALRCRWMNKKENGKRRKEDHNSRKNKDKKVLVGFLCGSSQIQSQQLVELLDSFLSKVLMSWIKFLPTFLLLSFNDLPEIMKQMPPLPVKLNEELASSILPRTTLAKKS